METYYNLPKNYTRFRCLLNLLSSMPLCLSVLCVAGQTASAQTYRVNFTANANSGILANVIQYDGQAIFYEDTYPINASATFSLNVDADVDRIDYGVPVRAESGRYFFHTYSANNSVPVLANPLKGYRGDFGAGVYAIYDGLIASNTYSFGAVYINFFELHLNYNDRKQDPFYFDTGTGNWSSCASEGGAPIQLFSIGSQTLSVAYPLATILDTTDALTDPSYWNKSTGEWISRFSSTGQTVKLGTFGSPSSGDVPAVEDFDADGVSDRTLYNGSNNQWKSIYSSLLVNSGSFAINPTNNNLYQVARVADGRLAFFGSALGQAWTSPVYFGSGTIGSPAMVRTSNGTFVVVAATASGALVQYNRDPATGVWSSGQIFGGNIAGSPTLVDTGSGLQVLVVNTAGAIYQFSKTGYTTTTAWSGISFGSGAIGKPAALWVNNQTLLVTYANTSGGYSHYYKTGSGAWTAAGSMAVSSSSLTSNPTMIYAPSGYVNVVGATSGGQLAQFSSLIGSGSWSGPVLVGSGIAGQPTMTLDSNGYLRVVSPRSGGGLREYFRNPSAGTWSGAVDFASGVTGVPPQVVEIVANPGKLMLSVPGPSGGYQAYDNLSGTWTLKATSTTMPGYGSSLGTYPYNGFQGRPIPADYDGDGKADLAAYATDGGNYYIKYSSNGTSKQYGSIFDISSPQYLPQGYELPGDYDGDGKVDPATAYVDSDGVYTYFNVVYQSSASGSGFTNYFAAYTGGPINSYLRPLSGDFDGDGKSDIAVFYPAYNYIHYLPSKGGSVVETANNCGYSANTTVNFTNVGVNFALSPILIDTNGDGFALTSAEEGAPFDLQGYGMVAKNSWTQAGSDDAFLVLDRNENGLIDNGRELFGNYAAQPASVNPNGFLALATFDKLDKGGNGDGVISQADSIFTQLRLWMDSNHDGLSQAEELFTLPSKGIAKLDLDYKESRRKDKYGNAFRYRARVYDESGAANGRWAWDVFFQAAAPSAGSELSPDLANPVLDQPLGK